MSVPPDLDPQLADWMRRNESDHEPDDVEESRAHSRRSNALALEHLDPALVPASEEDTDADGIPVRIVRPARTDESGERVLDDSPHPTIVYIHGGGWVIDDLNTHRTHVSRLCSEAQAVVVSVDYRLAPEHRFPAAFEDAVQATEWAAQRLAELGGTDQLVVAGDSAGGQLAASVAIARRDAGAPLAAQLLLYPATDVAGLYADDEVNARYPSRAAYAEGYGLTLKGMVDGIQHYLSAEDSGDWRVSPIRAKDLHGVAPAVIHTGALDVLCSEAEQYADALRAAGVDVISRTFPGLNHSYYPLGGVSAAADAAAAQAATDLLDLLSRGTGAASG